MKRNKAFTLIEILLVLIITGIVLALAAPNFSKGYSRFQLSRTVSDLLQSSRWAQAMAIGQERIYALTFSDDGRSYGLTRAVINAETDEQDSFEPVHGPLGRTHPVPEAVHLEASQDRIEFYPDGTIDPATIQMATSGQKTELSSTQVRGMMSEVNGQ